MRAKHLVWNWLTALEEGDLSTAKNLLADDFVCVGLTPSPLDRNQFQNVYTALFAALPDLAFNPKNFEEVGNTVSVDLGITGTHIRTLELPLPDVPRVSPTGNNIRLPRGRAEFTIANRKITRFDLTPMGLGIVVHAILGQMGVRPPEQTPSVSMQP